MLDAKLGVVLVTAEQYGAAVAVLERAACMYHDAGDLAEEATVLSRLGEAHFHQGATGAGIGRLQGFLDSAASSSEGLPAARQAELYASLPLLLFAVGRYAEQLEAAERAAALHAR